MSWRDSITGAVTLALAVVSLYAAPAPRPASSPREMFVTVGKSVVVDSPVIIERVSIADDKVAEAVAANPREIVVNGKAPGETSLIVWQKGGSRLMFDLRVVPNPRHLESVREELRKELPEQPVTVSVEEGVVYLRGTVNDPTSGARAVGIAKSLGEPVNLLNIKVPPVEKQILLKVRFANVDRGASKDLGANIISMGALNTQGVLTTGQFPSARLQQMPLEQFRLTDVLNVFLFRPDLDLGAFIKALQSKRLLQMLAEPNLLTIDGKPASFLAGGEFPFPTLQGGGAGIGQVTIQFREFGVRINFLPRITPRGTVRLQVTPEVSSLDFANGLVFQGFTVPALSTRRVQTEIELEEGQSFAIGGLLDNRVVESWSKIPGLGDIPLIGKIFQSKSVQRNNTELLVLVTPEFVRPIPKGQPRPEISFPEEFMKGTSGTPPRTPGTDVTGPVPVKPERETMPLEEWLRIQQELAKPAPGAQAPGQAAAPFVSLGAGATSPQGR